MPDAIQELLASLPPATHRSPVGTVAIHAADVERMGGDLARVEAWVMAAGGYLDGPISPHPPASESPVFVYVVPRQALRGDRR